MINVKMVEKVNPKMMVQARIPQKTAESEPINMCGSSSVNKVVKSMLRPSASGISPKTAADAVNKTGVKRIPPPSIIASFKSYPRFNLSSSINSMSKIPFLTTIPAKAMTPTPDMMIEKVIPKAIKPNNTPINDNNIVAKIMSGLTAELNCVARIK